MSPTKKQLLGFCHRAAYATLLVGAVFIAAIAPSESRTSRPNPALLAVVRIVDFPIASLGLLLPCEERGLDLVTSERATCSPPPSSKFFWNHMRIGVPLYIAIFYLPTLFSSRRGRQRLAPPPETRSRVTAAEN